MKQWDKIFRKHGKYFTKAHKALPQIVKLLRERRIKRILALGCGSGRNIVYLAQKGFLVYGIDSSREGIKIAKNWLKNKGVKADLKIGSVYKKLPYKANSFGAVLAVSVLQHGKIKDIKRAIREIERVLRPKGFLFLTVPKKKPEFKKERIEPRTYIFLEGKERGALHYFYNKRLLKKDLKNFDVYKIWIDYWDYLAFLGRLKDNNN